MKVSIVGAGIGGLALKIALDGLGVSSDLYEASDDLPSGGGALGIQANAMFVLRKLGLSEAIDKVGTPIEQGFVVDDKLARLRAFPKRAFGVAVPRAELLQILLSRVGREQVSWGKRLSSLARQPGGGLVLRFEGGTSADTDVLIGADGIRSTVRSALAPSTQPRFTGQCYFAGFSDYQLAPADQHTFREAWGKGLKFGIVPLGRRGVYWFACLKSTSGQYYEQESYREVVAHAFREFAEPVGAIIQQAHGIFHSKIYDIHPTDGVWHDERTCLIGDAAHATTPNLAQGACQALEDAYLLALLLSRVQHMSDLPKTFARFKALRLAKVQQVVELSWSTGNMSLYERPVSIAFRNFMLKTLPRAITDAQVAKIIDMSYLDASDLRCTNTQVSPTERSTRWQAS